MSAEKTPAVLALEVLNHAALRALTGAQRADHDLLYSAALVKEDMLGVAALVREAEAHVQELADELRIRTEQRAQQEEHMRSMRDEGLVLAQEANDARRLKATLVQLAEQMRKVSYLRLDAVTAESQTLNDLYHQLLGEPVRPLGATPQPTTTTEPRAAASGAR